MEFTFGGAIEVDVTTDRTKMKVRTQKEQRAIADAYERRQAILALPFPIIFGGRVLTTTYPHAGVITNPNFVSAPGTKVSLKPVVRDGDGFAIPVDL